MNNGKAPWTVVEAILAITCVIALLAIGGLYVYYWQIWYNSDYAVPGLIGKHVLETGQCPIFIGQTGYQGMFLEGELLALLFKIFGVGPRTLDFEPFLFLLAMFWFYYKDLEFSIGRRKALITLLFAIISTPHFYGHVIRTVPNYTETFFFGFLLIWIYLNLIRDLYLDKVAPGWKHYTYAAFFGLIAGFAFYTYGQIVYFFAVIALHLSFIYLRSLHPATIHELFYRLFFPAFQLGRSPLFSILKAINLLGLLALAAGFILLICVPYGSKLPFAPLDLLVSAIVTIVALNGVGCLLNCYSRIRQHIKLGGVAINMFIIGVSPSLYYFIINLDSAPPSKLGIAGHVSDFWERFKFVIEGLIRFNNIDQLNIISILLGIFITFSAIRFIYKTLSRVEKFVCHAVPETELLNISPIGLLPLVVIPAFIVSASIIDSASERYELVLILFTALAVGDTCADMLSRQPLLLRASTLVLSAILLLNNGKALQREFINVKGGFAFLSDVALWLSAHDVKYGYADYWYAYSIDFLTNEKIMLEPTKSEYLPYYSQIVADASQIAYVTSNAANDYGGTLILNDTQYTILDQTAVQNMHIYLLKKRL